MLDTALSQFDLQWNNCEGFVCLIASERTGDGKILLAYADRGVDFQYIAAVRTWNFIGEPEQEFILRSEALRQAKNLQEKIKTLDCLGLTEFKLATMFAGARVFAVPPSRYSEQDCWNWIREALDELRSAFPDKIIFQLDYDQNRMHPGMGSAIDTLEFKTKHYPSAIGTVAVFDTLLRSRNIAAGSAKWGVRGVGDLGCRIVRLLLDRGAQCVMIYDHDPARMEQFSDDPAVFCCTAEEFSFAEVDAHITAAHAGWFNIDEAKRLRSNKSLSAFGGPEAALDRHAEAILLLSDANIEFVPSLLCGAMGLVANLCEISGLIESEAEMQTRLCGVTERIISRSKRDGVPFFQSLNATVKEGMLG